MSISKEQIEHRVSHKDILDHFLKPYYGGRPIKQGELISNPLLARKQETPSFNVHFKGGVWRWKDFTGMSGSCFDLVMIMYGVSFNEACSIINQEMNLGLESDFNKVVKPVYVPKKEPEYIDERNYNYDVEHMKWTKELLTFWERYGIKQEHLDYYNVNALRSVYAYNKNNEMYHIEATSTEPIYGYIQEGWAKIYRPYSHPMKFLYIGDKPKDFVFGLEELPEKGKTLYLVGGEKDVITMYAHGMSAVCLNSETSSLLNYPKLLELFKGNRFDKYVVLYDNDEVGIEQMDKVVEEFPIFTKKVVPELDYGNDISDWYKNYYNGNK